MSEKDVWIHAAEDGALEGRLAVPASPRGGVVLCHPHPLYGGDMENPVIVRAAEGCAEAAVATLRFNFRGVGKSGGTWAEGRGEQEDLRAALRALAREVGGAPLGALGYSFGAWIAALVACAGEPLAGLALVAPALGLFDFGCLEALPPRPLHLAAGTRDQFCPLDRFQALAARLPWATATVIDGADHFFFGKLFPLGQAITAFAQNLAAQGTIVRGPAR
jgi:alpha/beta superfamily hydrolase